MKTRYLNELLDADLLIDRQEPERQLIKKIVYDSRKADMNSLFVAISGFTTDGHQYLQQAKDKGISP